MVPRSARFLTHPIFSQSGFGKHHPLSIPRHSAVIGLCGTLGWLDAGETVACPLPDAGVLARYHDPVYLEAFEGAALRLSASPDVRARYNLGTMECPLFPGLWDRARATVGGSMTAARLALEGHVAFHPAGGTHHGKRDRASGFCYLNDPVFAILTFLDCGLDRVLYVDLDAHHGDGVEDAFAADPRVMTISLHEAGRWPGTGALDDRRLGRARNLPVPRGLNDTEFRFLIHEAVLPVSAGFDPQALVVTCGVDALAGDPLSGLELSNVALCDAVEALLGVCPRAVVLGGGGYNPWTLARAWTGLWGRLSGRDATTPLPPAARALLASLDCDLVDIEDRQPEWLEALWDQPRPGRIREELKRAAASFTASTISG